MGGTGNAYRIPMGIPLRKISIDKLKGKYDNNINMDLREIGCDDGRWMELSHDRIQTY
jgi:hypothetical protein